MTKMNNAGTELPAPYFDLFVGIRCCSSISVGLPWSVYTTGTVPGNVVIYASECMIEARQHVQNRLQYRYFL